MRWIPERGNIQYPSLEFLGYATLCINHGLMFKLPFRYSRIPMIPQMKNGGSSCVVRAGLYEFCPQTRPDVSEFVRWDPCEIGTVRDTQDAVCTDRQRDCGGLGEVSVVTVTGLDRTLTKSHYRLPSRSNCISPYHQGCPRLRLLTRRTPSRGG